MRFDSRGLGWVGVGLLVAACAGDPFGPAPGDPAPIGQINLTVTTVGDDIDSDGYGAQVDDGAPHSVGTNGSVTIEHVKMGTHIVRLAGVALNCIAAGERSVEVTSTTSIPSVTFVVSCFPNGELAFVGKDFQNLYTINADGTGTLQLTKDQGYQDPAWSPDGSRLAFARYRIQQGRSIFVMNSNGSGTLSLTTAAADESSPAWSPDGSRIAFVRRGGDNSEIDVMNADGTNRMRLTTGTMGGDDTDPAWSPDGSRIAFTRSSKIYVMNPDGSGVTQLSVDAANDREPAWSPDSRMIAFSRGTADGNSAIFTMEADGSNPTRLTPDSHAGNPAWSKDGRIALEIVECHPDPFDFWYGSEVCTGEILVIRPDKTTTSIGLALQPSWRQ